MYQLIVAVRASLTALPQSLTIWEIFSFRGAATLFGSPGQ